MSYTPLRQVGHFAAEHLTWLSLCGLVAVITGFTPEEWVAHLAEELRVSGVVDGHWPKYLDIRAVLVAVGVGIIVTDVLLKRRAVSPAPTLSGHGPSTAKPSSPSAPGQERMRSELDRLLKRAPSHKTDEAQREWAAEVNPLLDAFLGPGSTNIHSEPYYEFVFASSHAEKTAVLRSILRVGAASRTAAEKLPQAYRDRTRARNNSIVVDALKSRAGITDCWVMQLEDHSDKGYLISVAFDSTLSAADVLSMIRQMFAERLPDTPIFGEMKSESDGKILFAYTYLDEYNRTFKSS